MVGEFASRLVGRSAVSWSTDWDVPWIVVYAKYMIAPIHSRCQVADVENSLLGYSNTLVS